MAEQALNNDPGTSDVIVDDNITSQGEPDTQGLSGQVPSPNLAKTLNDAIGQYINNMLPKKQIEDLADRKLDDAVSASLRYTIGRGVSGPSTFDVVAAFQNSKDGVTVKQVSDDSVAKVTKDDQASAFSKVYGVDYCPKLTTRLEDMAGFAELFLTLPYTTEPNVVKDGKYGLNLHINYRLSPQDNKYDHRVALRYEDITCFFGRKDSVAPWTIGTTYNKRNFPVRVDESLKTNLMGTTSSLGSAKQLKAIWGGRDDDEHWRFLREKAPLLNGGDNHILFLCNAFRYYFSALEREMFQHEVQWSNDSAPVVYRTMDSGRSWRNAFSTERFQAVYSHSDDLDYLHFLGVVCQLGCSKIRSSKVYNNEVYVSDFDKLNFVSQRPLLLCGPAKISTIDVTPDWAGASCIILAHIRRYCEENGIARQMGEAARITLSLPYLKDNGFSPLLPEPMHTNDLFPQLIEDTISDDPVGVLSTFEPLRFMLGAKLLYPSILGAIDLIKESFLSKRGGPTVTNRDWQILARHFSGNRDTISRSFASILTEMVGMDLTYLSLLRIFDDVPTLIQKNNFRLRQPLIYWLSLNKVPQNTWAAWILGGFTIPSDMLTSQFPEVSELDIYAFGQLGILDGNKCLTSAFSKSNFYATSITRYWNYPGGNFNEFAALVGKRTTLLVDSILLTAGQTTIKGTTLPGDLKSKTIPTANTGGGSDFSDLEELDINISNIPNQAPQQTLSAEARNEISQYGIKIQQLSDDFKAEKLESTKMINNLLNMNKQLMSELAKKADAKLEKEPPSTQGPKDVSSASKPAEKPKVEILGNKQVPKDLGVPKTEPIKPKIAEKSVERTKKVTELKRSEKHFSQPQIKEYFQGLQHIITSINRNVLQTWKAECIDIVKASGTSVPAPENGLKFLLDSGFRRTSFLRGRERRGDGAFSVAFLDWWATKKDKKTFKSRSDILKQYKETANPRGPILAQEIALMATHFNLALVVCDFKNKKFCVMGNYTMTDLDKACILQFNEDHNSWTVLFASQKDLDKWDRDMNDGLLSLKNRDTLDISELGLEGTGKPERSTPKKDTKLKNKVTGQGAIEVPLSQFLPKEKKKVESKRSGLKPWMVHREKHFSRSGWRSKLNSQIQRKEVVVPEGFYFDPKIRSEVESISSSQASDFVRKLKLDYKPEYKSHPEKINDYIYYHGKVQRRIFDWVNSIYESQTAEGANDDDNRSVASINSLPASVTSYSNLKSQKADKVGLLRWVSDKKDVSNLSDIDVPKAKGFNDLPDLYEGNRPVEERQKLMDNFENLNEDIHAILEEQSTKRQIAFTTKMAAVHEEGATTQGFFEVGRQMVTLMKQDMWSRSASKNPAFIKALMDNLEKEKYVLELKVAGRPAWSDVGYNFDRDFSDNVVNPDYRLAAWGKDRSEKVREHFAHYPMRFDSHTDHLQQNDWEREISMKSCGYKNIENKFNDKFIS